MRRHTRGVTLETLPMCPNCERELSFISAEKAADIIGVSYSRVRAILNDNPGRLKAFKVGERWLIPEHAAKEFKPLPPHRPPKKYTEPS